MALPFVSDKAKKMIDLVRSCFFLRFVQTRSSAGCSHIPDLILTSLIQVEKWVAEECIPADNVYSSQLSAQASRWSGHPSILETLKSRAKALGIWNMFLPKNHFANEGSPGFTNLEYGLMAEQLGKSRIASEACNCAAPDTGNMEVIARYGNRAQKDKWLRPLLDGQIR
jgi:acyl-CoA dehydrogenase